MLVPAMAMTGLRSAAVMERDGEELRVRQFVDGKPVDRMVRLSEVEYVLVDCDCDASLPCLQGKTASEERCSIWVKLDG